MNKFIASLVLGSSLVTLAAPVAFADHYEDTPEHGHEEAHPDASSKSERKEKRRVERRPDTPPYVAPVAKHSDSIYGWGAVAQIALTFGGDELAEVVVEDFFGDDDEADLHAGELFQLGIGATYRFPNSPFQLQSTIGYHVGGIFADNGDISIERFPLEILGLFNIEQHRVGFGITHHLNPQFEFDIDFEPESRVDFRNATGFVAQYDYRISEYFSLGLRYVDIEYEPESSDRFGPNGLREDVDANHVGIIMSFFW